jgi:multicomponent Na+:H+ antiporter subunit G
MHAPSALEAVRVGVAGLLIGAGLLVMAGGALGNWRFPDFYTRLHADRVGDSAGIALVLLGLCVAAGDWTMAVKLLTLAGLVIASSPLIAQLNAHAAHAAGLAPLAGSYLAPRPNAKGAP